MAYQVSVCGPSDCTEQDASSAYRVGQLLAEAGVVVLCGGGPGVMAAVAAGARSRDGIVVGIYPGNTIDAATAGLSVNIVTNMGEARNVIIAWSANALIAVGGSWGTLSEIALAKQRGRIPVVCLGGWRIRGEKDQPVDGVDYVDSPEDAVTAAMARPD